MSIISETGEQLEYEYPYYDRACTDDLRVEKLKKVRIVDDSGELDPVNDMVTFFGKFHSVKNKNGMSQGEYTVVVGLRQYEAEDISIEFPITFKNR